MVNSAIIRASYLSQFANLFAAFQHGSFFSWNLASVKMGQEIDCAGTLTYRITKDKVLSQKPSNWFGLPRHSMGRWYGFFLKLLFCWNLKISGCSPNLRMDPIGLSLGPCVPSGPRLARYACQRPDKPISLKPFYYDYMIYHFQILSHYWKTFDLSRFLKERILTEGFIHKILMRCNYVVQI